MHSGLICIAFCLSVRLSVCPSVCDKMTGSRSAQRSWYRQVGSCQRQVAFLNMNWYPSLDHKVVIKGQKMGDDHLKIFWQESSPNRMKNFVWKTGFEERSKHCTSPYLLNYRLIISVLLFKTNTYFVQFKQVNQIVITIGWLLINLTCHGMRMHSNFIVNGKTQRIHYSKKLFSLTRVRMKKSFIGTNSAKRSLKQLLVLECKVS